MDLSLQMMKFVALWYLFCEEGEGYVHLRILASRVAGVHVFVCVGCSADAVLGSSGPYTLTCCNTLSPCMKLSCSRACKEPFKNLPMASRIIVTDC
jgi:hypothetical protein